jgi:hypothetical protein
MTVALLLLFVVAIVLPSAALAAALWFPFCFAGRELALEAATRLPRHSFRLPCHHLWPDDVRRAVSGACRKKAQTLVALGALNAFFWMILSA